MANISLEVVFRKLFLILSSTNIDFSGRKLPWRTYTTKEALSTSSRIELVGKNEFAAATLIPKHETYIVYIVSVSSVPLPSSSLLKLIVHPSCKPQMSGLIAKEACTKVSAEYLDFADVFSLDLVSKLPKHTGINDHAIELVNGQQPPYGLIYSLKPMELEILKTYIETNLANGFIKPSKLPVGALILFKQKSDGFL